MANEFGTPTPELSELLLKLALQSAPKQEINSDSTNSKILNGSETDRISPESWRGYTRPVRVIPPGRHHSYPLTRKLRDLLGSLIGKVLNNFHTP